MNSGYGATDYKLEDTMDDEQARELLFKTRNIQQQEFHDKMSSADS